MNMPNATVPFVDGTGYVARPYAVLLPDLPTVALVNRDGTPTREMTAYLQGKRVAMPEPSVALVDRQGRPTRVMFAVLRVL